MRTIYECIKERERSRRNIIATVIGGAHMGEKIFLSGADTLWLSREGRFIEGLADKIRSAQGNTIMSADGERIFCEIIGNPKTLVICGGGHVSMPVIRLGKMTGFYVIVLEDRPKFAQAAKEAGADECICEPFQSGMQKLAWDRDTYVVIVTRGHRHDSICLREAAGKTTAYIGMMGSRKRVGIVKEALIEEGIDRTLLDKVHTPIGLSIGAETPEEIAISIMSEIIQVKNKEKRTVSCEGELLEGLTARDDKSPGKVLATIVSRTGSAPRETGTKMLVYPDGTITGTVGGGYAESHIIQEALLLMEKEEQIMKVVSVEMLGEEAEEAGMVCGGIIEVLLERVHG